MLYDESQIVIERINGQTITEATLIQTAVSSIISKGGRKQFSKLVKSLNVEVSPRLGLFDEGN